MGKYTIEIKKENFYIGYWIADIGAGDFMGVGWKEPDGPWQVRFRIRYHDDDKVWGSKDRKQWGGFTAKDGSIESMEMVKKVMNRLLREGYALDMVNSGAFVECMGDGEEMIKVMSNGDRPYLSSKVLTKEQFAEYEKTGKLPDESV